MTKRLTVKEKENIIKKTLKLFNSNEVGLKVQKAIIKAINILDYNLDSTTEGMELHIKFIDTLMSNKKRLNELKIEMSF